MTMIELFDIVMAVYETRESLVIPGGELVEFVLSQQSKVNWLVNGDTVVISPRDDKPYGRMA